MRVVVTGGRNYQNKQHVYEVLDSVHSDHIITLLVTGACVYGGADLHAENWAKDREVTYAGMPAKWKTGTKGRAEGHIRNAVMLDTFKPDLVVAFPGGNGTAGCVKEAKKRNIRVEQHD